MACFVLSFFHYVSSEISEESQKGMAIFRSVDILSVLLLFGHSHLHLLAWGRWRQNVEAGLHHDSRLAQVYAKLQLCRRLSQSLQVVLRVLVQIWIHIN